MSAERLEPPVAEVEAHRNLRIADAGIDQVPRPACSQIEDFQGKIGEIEAYFMIGEVPVIAAMKIGRADRRLIAEGLREAPAGQPVIGSITAAGCDGQPTERLQRTIPR